MEWSWGGQALGMFANDLLCPLENFALAAIGKLAVGFVEGKPECFAQLVAHVWANRAQAPGCIEKQGEADRLGDVLTASPGAHIKVADRGEPEQTQAMHSSL